MSTGAAPPIQILKLAAMECAASCVMTGLNIIGEDPKYFVMGCWNLNYFAKTMFSARNMRNHDLAPAYGIQTSLRSGFPQDIAAALESGSIVMMLCYASRLPFFPAAMLGFETSGIQHYILIHHYDKATGTFSVVDPIAGYAGDLSEAELCMASIRTEDLIYYEWEREAIFRRPPDRLLFLEAAKSNYKYFVESKLHTGSRAIDAFSRDLRRNTAEDAPDREEWLERNTITISSIVKTRALIWDNFASLGLMTDQQTGHGASLIGQIVKLWTTVNFQFIKLKKKSASEDLIESVQNRLEQVKQIEHSFLEFLYARGRELNGY